MLHMRNWIAGLILLVVPGCPRILAQGEAVTARMTGTVLDPQEMVVPQARVTLSNNEAGFTRHFLTDSDGRYIFTAVPPGRYQLKVVKEGFSTYLKSDVVLTIGQSTTLDLNLALGEINQVVEVTTDATLLNSGNANLGSEVSWKQLVELPLNLRNIYNLVQLSSNVNNSTQYQGLT